MAEQGPPAGGEGEAQRAVRRYQRTLFDEVAELYEETRPGYPRELVDWVAETAGLSAGSPVLEIGCGTGQLTAQLAAAGLRVTAIDLGASMVAAARERLGDADVAFCTGAFEDLEFPGASFDLVIAGAAFHWIDPEVRFAKSARLLRAGGWLAVAGSSDTYDEPLESLLEGLWKARGDVNGSWATQRVDAAVLAGSGLFRTPAARSWSTRMRRAPQDVIGVENTRAMSLSWPADVRASFNEDLRRLLAGQPVEVTVQSPVTMAQVSRVMEENAG